MYRDQKSGEESIMVKPDEKQFLNLPFTGISTFGKYPICDDIEKLNEVDADVAVIGVPNDMGTQWKSGARMGPRAVREGSTLYSFSREGAMAMEMAIPYLGPDGKVLDGGEVETIKGATMQSHDNTKEKGRRAAQKGVRPVTIGGDHSITAPVGK